MQKFHRLNSLRSKGCSVNPARMINFITQRFRFGARGRLVKAINLTLTNCPAAKIRVHSLHNGRIRLANQDEKTVALIFAFNL